MAQPSTNEGGSQGGPRQVQCIKRRRLLPGLAAKPFANELGQRLYDRVSQEAWQEWLVHSRTLINEYRLNLASPEGRKLLMEACDRFFFGDADTLPPDYTPPTSRPPSGGGGG
jgi:Fe-S cluster biosynthesis and repair protein YggX